MVRVFHARIFAEFSRQILEKSFISKRTPGKRTPIVLDSWLELEEDVQEW